MRVTSIWRSVFHSVWLAAMLLHGGQLRAQTFPTKPITLVVPFGPGTGNDIIARILAPKISEGLGQSMVVENRPGANGGIAAELVAKSQPDGYTLLIASTSSILNQFVSRDSHVDIAGDFAPVAFSGSLRNVLIGRRELAAGSMKDLIELARSKPGQLNFASGSSATRLVATVLKYTAKIDFTIIDYKLTTTGLVDVAEGRVDLLWTTTASAKSMANAGKVKLLGITGESRSPLFPSVATMTESGYPELNLGVDFFILAPVGTPKSVITSLNFQFAKAITAKEVRERLLFAGVEPKSSSPEELANYIRDNKARWARLVEETGYQPD